MSRVKIRVFAAQAKAAGDRWITIEVPMLPATCGELRAAVGRQIPAMNSTLAGCRFAVNHEFVGDEARVAGDEEIALIGAVSGG